MEKFALQWKHENIHVFNQTEKMVNQVLHIHLQPLSKLPAGFVAKLIARYHIIGGLDGEKRGGGGGGGGGGQKLEMTGTIAVPLRG